MKAWQVLRHGGNEVLGWTDRPTPVPGPNQVLIRVEAFALNHMDLWVRNGVPGHKFPLPIIPGCDISGSVESFGPGSEILAKEKGIARGSGVIINPGISCGTCQECLRGKEPLCPHYGILGETCDGGAAEYVVVPVFNLIARPQSLTPREAASLPIAFITAYEMLANKAALRSGDWVLIQAGGSGVGIAAIQIAKLMGAHVITTVGSPDKVGAAKALGADEVILYREKSVRDEIKRLTSHRLNRGVDIVVDHVGIDTFSESLRCLAKGGRLVTCGATSGSQIPIELKPIFFKNLAILGSTMGSQSDLVRLVDWAAQKKIIPVLDQEGDFTIDQYPQALKKLESRSFFGKLVITVGPCTPSAI